MSGLVEASKLDKMRDEMHRLSDEYRASEVAEKLTGRPDPDRAMKGYRAGLAAGWYIEAYGKRDEAAMDHLYAQVFRT